jgi:hypothetical protein
MARRPVVAMTTTQTNGVKCRIIALGRKKRLEYRKYPRVLFEAELGATLMAKPEDHTRSPDRWLHHRLISLFCQWGKASIST